MTLAQNNKKCNKEPAEFYKELALVANIVSDWCHHQILTPTNKSDLVATIILSELLFLHSATGKIELNNSYDYFRLKFDLSRTKVEAATLNLHNLGLVTRSFVPLQKASAKGSKFSEELYLKLNLNRILSPDLEAAEEIEDETSGDDLQELYFEEEYSYPEVCLSNTLYSWEANKELELAK